MTKSQQVFAALAGHYFKDFCLMCDTRGVNGSETEWVELDRHEDGWITLEQCLSCGVYFHRIPQQFIPSPVCFYTWSLDSSDRVLGDSRLDTNRLYTRGGNLSERARAFIAKKYVNG